MITFWPAGFGELTIEINSFGIKNNGDYKCVYLNKDDIIISQSTKLKCEAGNIIVVTLTSCKK